MAPKHVHPAVRLLSAYTVDGGGCWIPRNRPQSNGYVIVYLKNGTMTTAHRVVWEWVWGRQIPAGWTCDHLCRNPSCIRPDHVEPVPHRENLMRAPTSLAAINAAKTHCPRGHEYTRTTKRGKRVCYVCHNERRRVVTKNELEKDHQG